MGDIECLCGEPWEDYHLQHDAIWDTPDGMIFGPIWKTERAEGRNPMKFPGMRQAMEADGWKFACATSVLSITHCPACARREKDGEVLNTDKDKAEARAELAYLLGDDEDGLQAMMEDFEL